MSRDLKRKWINFIENVQETAQSIAKKIKNVKNHSENKKGDLVRIISAYTRKQYPVGYISTQWIFTDKIAITYAFILSYKFIDQRFCGLEDREPRIMVFENRNPVGGRGLSPNAGRSRSSSGPENACVF